MAKGRSSGSNREARPINPASLLLRTLPGFRMPFGSAWSLKEANADRRSAPSTLLASLAKYSPVA